MGEKRGERRGVLEGREGREGDVGGGWEPLRIPHVAADTTKRSAAIINSLGQLAKD